jgi:hypothetical protein
MRIRLGGGDLPPVPDGLADGARAGGREAAATGWIGRGVRIGSRCGGRTWLVAVLLLLAEEALGDPVEWTTAAGGTGGSYELVIAPSPLTWDEARDAAVSRGGHLAAITSAAENEFVKNLLPSGLSNDSIWIGGYQSPTTLSPASANWHWVTGESWSFTHWDAGEPTGSAPEPRIEMLGRGNAWGYWNNMPDYATTPHYVVEYAPPTTPVPEPMTASLFGAAALGLAWAARRRRR